MFASSWWSFLLPWKPSLSHQILVLLKTHYKFRQSLSNRCAYCSPFMFIEKDSFHGLTVVIRSNWSLNCKSERYFYAFKHHGPCRMLFLFIDSERTTVKTKIGVNFLHKFRKDTTFIVIGFMNGVWWTIEKCVLLSRMTMKVKVHEKSKRIL